MRLRASGRTLMLCGAREQPRGGDGAGRVHRASSAPRTSARTSRRRSTRARAVHDRLPIASPVTAGLEVLASYSCRNAITGGDSAPRASAGEIGCDGGDCQQQQRCPAKRGRVCGFEGVELRAHGRHEHPRSAEAGDCPHNYCQDALLLRTIRRMRAADDPSAMRNPSSGVRCARRCTVNKP